MCAIKYVRASALASFIRFPAYWNRITFRWFPFYTHYYKHETWSLCTWIELRLLKRNQRNEVFTLITPQNRDNFIKTGSSFAVNDQSRENQKNFCKVIKAIDNSSFVFNKAL